MNNLHRELAPISDAAWADIEEETTRTLKRHLAGRRVVDVHSAGGVGLSAVGTGPLKTIAAPGDGILARQRDVKALVEFRVPFELGRQQIDDVTGQTIPTGNLQRTPRRRSPMPRTKPFSRGTRRQVLSASVKELAIRA
jgi:uncharacterized linocin/CFP29 family protein